MVSIKNILIIEPFGKFSGHYSHFTKNIVDGFHYYKKNIDLLTFNGLYEYPISKIRHFQVLSFAPPIILRPFVKLLTKRVELTDKKNLLCSILCLIYAVILHRRYKYSGMYFLDGYILFSLLASFFAPIGIEIHNASFISSEPFRNRFLSRVYKIILYRLASSNKSLFFSAPNVYQNLPKWFIKKSNISVASWGIANAFVNTSNFRRMNQTLDRNSTIKLILFGINHNSKDYETIFSALNKLSQLKESKSFSLVIAGPLIPLEKNDPYILQQKYNLVNLKIIDKYLENDEIKKLFLESDYLIVAYRPDFEGTSSIIDFGMIYNVPIITSDSGDLYQRVKGENIGLVFNAGDVNDLIETLKLLPLPNSGKYLQFKEKLKKAYLRQLKSRSWLKSVYLRLEKLEHFYFSK